VIAPGQEIRDAQRADRGTVGRVVVDPLDLQSLVRRGQRHALDVGGERDAVDAQRQAAEATADAAGEPVGLAEAPGLAPPAYVLGWRSMPGASRSWRRERVRS
jgi:polysaccharide deacetylase 2 family uncharacterized protein YibQ